MIPFHIGEGKIDLKILREFSLTEFVAEITFGGHAFSLAELANLERVEVGGYTYKVLWRRAESNQYGPYFAVALRMQL